MSVKSVLNARIAAVGRFFKELRRRKVIRVAGIYGIVAWLSIQIATNTFPALQLPAWAITLVVVLAILGFPIAIILAWALEVTPAGIRAERLTEEQPAALPQPSQSPRVLSPSRSALPRPARARTVSTAPPEDSPPPADPTRAKRAVVAALRHDLRTPMNAILGYGSVLALEAQELGIAALVPDIQRLHAAAKGLLEKIDHLLPSGPESSEVDVNTIRRRLHDTLLQPTAALVEQSQQLLAAASTSERAAADLERQLGAARKLLALVQQLALAPAPVTETSEQAGFERVFNRLRPSAQPGTALHAGTLLVVDDNVMNRDVMTRQLVREGYGVFTAASGKEALEKLRLNDFDLVLLDVMMPEMDGVQVLEHIQRDPVLSEIPVVMVSSLDEIDSVARCIEKGAVDYFAKPFDPVLLSARVSATLQVRQLRQDLRRADDALAQNRTSIEALVRSVVPRPLSDSFERGEKSVCAHYPDVTAVVARLEGLDAIASRCGPDETIARVSKILATFDEYSKAKGLEIVRATERSYTAIVGAPVWREDHAEAAADFALDLREAIRKSLQDMTDRPEIRIGLNTGGLTAGVAGAERLVFGMWGDAVSTADAIACQASAGKIQVSAATSSKLNEKFDVGSPTMIEVPGHGHLRSYVLTGRKSSPAVH